MQGVYYRASARDAARRLGLNGWVRNMVDGRVEALACGTAEALGEFECWLASGPAHAHVSGVISEATGERPAEGFEIR